MTLPLRSMHVPQVCRISQVYLEQASSLRSMSGVDCTLGLMAVFSCGRCPLNSTPVDAEQQLNGAADQGSKEYDRQTIILRNSELVLARLASFSCRGWRQTAGCDVAGEVEPHNHLSCGSVVMQGRSGFCECGDGRTIGFGCLHEPFSCSHVCKGLAIPRESEPEPLALAPLQGFFFVHTSSEAELNPRYLCAIEAALSIASEREAEVRIYSNTLNVAALRESVGMLGHDKYEYGRAKLTVRPLNYTAFFAGTPLRKWYNLRARCLTDSSPDLQCAKEPFLLNNLSNAFRLAALLAHGGIYLDMDVILLRDNILFMGPTIGDQGLEELNNAVLKFPRRHPFLVAVIEDFVEEYNGEIWGWQGPSCLTRVYSYASMTDEPLVAGLEIQEPSVFFPIQHTDTLQLFRRHSCVKALATLVKSTQANPDRFCSASSGTKVSFNASTVHLWNKRSRNVPISAGSALELIMQSRCPYIHEREASQPEGSFKHGSGPVGFVTEPALGETKLSIGRDSVPASIAPTSPYRRYEAEDAFFYGATLQRIEDGTSAPRGCVQFENGSGSILEFMVNAEAASYLLTFGYTLPKDVPSASLDLLANHHIRGKVKFPGMYEDSCWSQASAMIEMKRGLNAVTLASIGEGLPCISYMTVEDI
mmetsp:Transcript_11772/g.43018  ORF Transcript_11772/g.43018 Transcript_11772/m.43018 type:complete len:647 (+) Transcript_11772:341-2281(+)